MLSLPRCVRDHQGTQATIGSFKHHGSKASFGFGLLRQCKTEGECNIGMKCSQKKWMNTVHWVLFFTQKSNLLPGLNNETTNLSSSFTQRIKWPLQSLYLTKGFFVGLPANFEEQPYRFQPNAQFLSLVPRSLSGTPANTTWRCF